MRLFTRLALLVVSLIVLLAVPAAWMARKTVTRILNVGLSSEIDTALKSGVSRARDQYQCLSRGLADSLGVWVAEAAGQGGRSEGVARAGAEGAARAAAEGVVLTTAADVLRAVAGPAGARLPGTQAVLKLPDGTIRVLRSAPSDTTTDTAGVPPSGYPPPRTADATRTLADGSVLTVRCPTSQAWRSDARAISSAFQMVRGQQYLRKELERSFWLPFLGLYAVSIPVALLVAGSLARGLLVPVQRLVHATHEVGAGNWNVRVPITGRDEINRLGEQFNDMVWRLDAQSRRLVELETMAGWREMARALAHEVRNPLTPIQLTVEEMRERYRGDDLEYAALLDKCSGIVFRQVESLRNVVARFRDFSRPVEPRFALVDLNALAADVGALQRDLHVELDLAPDLGTIRADDDQLRQLLMNLARNAQTATAGCESPRLRLATRAAGDNVVLEVEDNGPGIPAEERERVFEPYRSGSAGGLGLGLALVKGIVLAHGGSVRVEEGRLGGARLCVELRRDPEAKHD